MIKFLETLKKARNEQSYCKENFGHINAKSEKLIKL